MKLSITSVLATAALVALIYAPTSNLVARGAHEQAGAHHVSGEHHPEQMGGEHHVNEQHHLNNQQFHHPDSNMHRDVNSQRHADPYRYSGAGRNGEAVVVPVGGNNGYGDQDNYDPNAEEDALYNQDVQQSNQNSAQPQNININLEGGGSQ